MSGVYDFSKNHPPPQVKYVCAQRQNLFKGFIRWIGVNK